MIDEKNLSRQKEKKREEKKGGLVDDESTCLTTSRRMFKTGKLSGSLDSFFLSVMQMAITNIARHVICENTYLCTNDFLVLILFLFLFSVSSFSEILSTSSSSSLSSSFKSKGTYAVDPGRYLKRKKKK